MSQTATQGTGGSEPIIDSLIVAGDVGTASPIDKVLNILGDPPVSTIATGNTLLISVDFGDAGVVGFDGDSTLVGSPVTEHAVLVGGATSDTIKNVGPGTSGQVLVSGGPAADPSYQDVSDIGAVTILQCNSGSATPTNGLVILDGAGGITTSGAGNIVTIAFTGNFTWTVVTSASNPVALTANTGYIAKGASLVQFQLPSSASVGDTFKILGYSAMWAISQAANQVITIGSQSSTIGAGGSVSSTSATDGIELVCVTANNEFFETYVQGNPTLI